ncbi:MAG: secretin N-terminal domain-containing protein [Gammaproteobacteria bacterium]|nr:secretin N-terminal domain-containing protein [Gammaproteobacteria bacterium]
MKSTVLRTVCLLAVVSSFGCAGLSGASKQTMKDIVTVKPEPLVESLFDSKTKDDNSQTSGMVYQNRMPLVSMRNELPQSVAEGRYSLKVKNLSIHDTLNLFATTYNINVYAAPEVTGTVNVSFKDLPLDSAMNLILGSLGYYWEWSDNLVHVKKYKTITVELDYLRLTRGGTGSSSSSISSSGGNSGGGGTTSTQLTQKDSVAFWDELEVQLKAMLGASGTLAISKVSGTVQITDEFSRVKQIEQFLKHLKNGLHKQVEIEVRIVEVSLRDDMSMGINWENISLKGVTGALSNIVTQANGGLNLRSSTIDLQYGASNFTAVMSALSEQGKINVVSQPRIRAMNNQTALIKVGTDRTFFSQEVTRQQGTNGVTDIIITEIPTTVTEGVVLSLTPQISNDQWVLMDISPVITRVTDTVVSTQGSIAPVLDIKQTSTLVRARHGEMVMLGGLIQDQNVETLRGIPFLNKVPLLGRLFGGTYKTKVRKELVIFLVPKIVG